MVRRTGIRGTSLAIIADGFCWATFPRLFGESNLLRSYWLPVNVAVASVAESGSFTREAQITGRTQSAITRQIQSIEHQLGLSLLTRTTRSVVMTPAGKFLLQESAPVLGDVDVLLRRLREEYSDAPREVRVGVSLVVSASRISRASSRRT